MLLCVAGGMKFPSYSRTTGEISMNRKVGAITSAVHPVLGGLLHYTPSLLVVANESLEEIRMHSRAVNQGKGVWANAVSGKFNNRGVGRSFLGACLDETVLFHPPYKWPFSFRFKTEGTLFSQ